MKRQLRSQPRDTFGLAGWLLADLSLALAILFAASALPGVSPDTAVAASPSPSATPRPSPTPSPRPTSTVVPTPTPMPTPSPCVRTAVLRKHQVIVRADRSGRTPPGKRLLSAFSKYRGHQVGLLLTFGHGPNPAAGRKIAAGVNRLLKAKLAQQVTDRTILESFFNDIGPLGTVTFDIYLLAGSCDAP